MSTDIKRFRELHQQEKPLLLGNVWSAQSAKILESLNFKAIGTSSAAVAETLGYKDGEYMSFDEYYFIIQRIKAATTLPVTVDMEAGYGKKDEEIINNLERLHRLGIAGINIEDSVVNSSGRVIVDTDGFAKKLEGIIRSLKSSGIDIFINVRCDAFLLNLPDARKEALKRIAAYEKTGAHGIFLPCITDVEDIQAAVKATSLPINVMCMPALPDFGVLQSLGVKRISMGNFINGSIYNKMKEISASIVAENSFSPLFK
jgi:2-methylisocitrate lyase-like PEP mutase family enzyme